MLLMLLLLLLLRIRRLVAELRMVVVYTSLGRRLRDGAATRLRVRLPGGLIEQDEVVLIVGQVEMLKMQLLRGCCRQARWSGGKP